MLFDLRDSKVKSGAISVPEESVALVHSLEESSVADEDAEVLGEGLSLQSQPHPRPRVTDLRLEVK